MAPRSSDPCAGASLQVPDLAAVVDAAPGGMLIVDQNGLVVLSNRALEVLLGYDRSELVGKPVASLVSAGTSMRRNELDSWLGGNGPTRRIGLDADVRARHREGHELPVDIGLSMIRDGGRRYVVVAVVDVSARGPAPAADDPGAAGEAGASGYARQMQAVGRLAGSFAHDFNNILAAVLGSAELALESGVDADVEADLEMIVSSAKRGREIVERLLGFSRRRPLDRKVHALSEIVTRAEPLLRERLPKGVELQVSCGCDDRLLADLDAIHQLLLALVLNAAHEMRSGGSIRITCRSESPADLPGWSADTSIGVRYVEVTVRDTGPGEAVRALDSLLTDRSGRTGPPSMDAMGLAVAFAIAEDHGGAIDVRQVAGEGTTVRCRLPVHDLSLDEQAPVR